MPGRDLQNLLRNVYCFLEILQTSRSEKVASWEKESLENALKWAAFAEQVAIEVQAESALRIRKTSLLLRMQSRPRGAPDIQMLSDKVLTVSARLSLQHVPAQANQCRHRPEALFGTPT